MAKSFRQFVAEVAQPISKGEIDFLKTHVTVLIDYPADVEDQFTGGDITKFTRLADYKPGQDVQAYDQYADNNRKEVQYAEIERHKKREIIDNIFSESKETVSNLELDEDVVNECKEALLALSEDNINYAVENGINLVEFAYKLVK